MKSNGITTDWIARWAHYSPAGIALTDDATGRNFTYQDLDILASRTAGYLQQQFGINPGDRVAVLSTNEPDYIPLFYALQRAGAIMVPLSFRLSSRELAFQLADSSPSLLISQMQFSEIVSGIPEDSKPPAHLNFDGENSLSSLMHNENLAASFTPTAPDMDTPCMILYTSGTTGRPKGALITHGMLFWNSVNTGLRLNLVQQDVTLTFAPFFHTGGWNVLTTPFHHRGARVILLRKFDPARILHLCESEGVSILFGVPTMMDMLSREPEFAGKDLQNIRYAIVGGEPMPLELIRTWHKKGVPIRQGYGLTEFGPNVFSLNEEDAERKIGSIGFPNFYIETRVANDDGTECGVDEPGELLLKGPACMSGYWNNDMATAETIRNGWLHTGDIVRRDAEGYFYVVGRKKDMFISGAENVYPAEIEHFLRTHPLIREVAVIGVPDSKWGEVGRAFIVAEPGEKLTSEDIRDFCEGNLARYKIPKHFTFLNELPKSDSGKILKRALREKL
ncbi:MAG: long-chain fatty acid--CoA ligase [Rhodothermaceae bacterium]|nr:long-chain fatty acid--CoA ligase [Rhodothermaceae bacterium]